MCSASEHYWGMKDTGKIVSATLSLIALLSSIYFHLKMETDATLPTMANLRMEHNLLQAIAAARMNVNSADNTANLKDIFSPSLFNKDRFHGNARRLRLLHKTLWTPGSASYAMFSTKAHTTARIAAGHRWRCIRWSGKIHHCYWFRYMILIQMFYSIAYLWNVEMWMIFKICEVTVLRMGSNFETYFKTPKR